MQLNTKIQINLLEFFKYGKFDYIELGNSKQWIINNFPNPDGFNKSFFQKKCSIWRYGNLEFHFDGDVLYQIYSDYINQLNAGEHIQLDKWILATPSKLTLLYVIEHLNNEKIEYKKVNFLQTQVQLILQSGVILGFDNLSKQNDMSVNQFLLSYFSYK